MDNNFLDKFGLTVTPPSDIEIRMSALQFVSDLSRGKSITMSEMLEYADHVEKYIKNGVYVKEDPMVYDNKP